VLVPLITVIALLCLSAGRGGADRDDLCLAGPGQLHHRCALVADMPAVLGGTVVVGVAYIGLNMLSDILYRLVDPRARTDGRTLRDWLRDQNPTSRRRRGWGRPIWAGCASGAIRWRWRG
jgi:hypothetical protein